MTDYSAIYPWITDCLRSARAEVVDADFDRTIKSELRSILAPVSVSYDDLTAGDDKDAIDEAVGLRTAARLYRSLVTDGLGGGLKSVKDDESSEDYVDPAAMIEQWEREANAALAGVSFIPSAANTGPRFALNGPSRHRCGCDS